MSDIAVQQTMGLETEPLAMQLTRWPPDMDGLENGWASMLQVFFESAAGKTLNSKIEKSLVAGDVVYPPDPLMALRLTPLKKVRVVILGQDPYHGPGQAQGLAFSVAPGVRVPPSLCNIFKELTQSLGLLPSAHGSLVRWSLQGVLLLNTCLTVEAGKPASHAHWGWEALTDEVVRAVAANDRPVVFMLWGAHAQAKKVQIEAADPERRHLILQANHPSPLSAMRPPRPFFGSRHFALANEFLKKNGIKVIEW